MKRLIKFIAVICLILVIMFIGSRYGWRIFGFNYCEDPESLFMNSIKAEENLVTISGDTSKSAPSFIGSIYEVSNGNLYIGLKYNLLFGFFKRQGRFDVRIAVDTNQIQAIYLKNSSSQKMIWKRD